MKKFGVNYLQNFKLCVLQLYLNACFNNGNESNKNPIHKSG